MQQIRKRLRIRPKSYRLIFRCRAGQIVNGVSGLNVLTLPVVETRGFSVLRGRRRGPIWSSRVLRPLPERLGDYGRHGSRVPRGTFLETSGDAVHEGEPALRQAEDHMVAAGEGYIAATLVLIV